MTLSSIKRVDRSACKIDNSFVTENKAEDSNTIQDSQDWVSLPRERFASQPAPSIDRRADRDLTFVSLLKIRQTP